MIILSQYKVLHRNRKCFFVIAALFVIFVTTRGDNFRYIPFDLSSVTQQIGGYLKQSDRGLQHRYTPRNATMVKHLRFLKVHKCASSTVQNMMFRFALRHSLTIALPKGLNYIGTMGDMIPLPSKHTHYDVFACHTIYSKPWFDAMPVPSDAVNIAIVREPRDRMISAAYRYRHGGVKYLKKVPKENFIHNLLTFPEKYDKGKFTSTKNTMGRDFGFSPHIKPNETSKIDNYIKFLENEFQLVLIVERFHESLVLLKRKLNWNLEDIIYRVLHSYEHENVSRSNEDLRRMNQLNFLDYAVYQHFAMVFDEKIRNEPNDFREEVQHFHDTIRITTAFCDDSTKHELEIEESEWNAKFTLTRSECDLMKTKELSFISNLKRHVKEKNNSSLRNMGLMDFGNFRERSVKNGNDKKLRMSFRKTSDVFR